MTISQLASMNYAYRNLAINNNAQNQSMRKLSSGYRINSAADDAAGLAISERMRGQIRGLNMATQNASNAVNMVQTAEGGLQNTADTLVRMRELAVQASNGTYSDDQRALINREFQELMGSIDQTASSTHYNGINLLDGSLGGARGDAGIRSLGITDIAMGAGSTLEGSLGLSVESAAGATSITATIGGETVTNQLSAGDTSTTFTFADGSTMQVDFTGGLSSLSQGSISGIGVEAGATAVNTSGAVTTTPGSAAQFQVGANGGADQRLSLQIGDMSSRGLGIAGLDISTLNGANAAIEAIDNAMNSVNSQRSTLGASQNRLEHTISNLTSSSINTQASESSIRDLNFAEEIMNYTQRNIMTQASMAMLAQSMNMTRSYAMGLLMR